MLRSPASLLALTLAGVLAACGGSSSNPMAPTPTTTVTPTPTPTATPTAAATITIQAFTWMPQNLEVAPGTTVTVVNKDNTQHSVTSEATPGAFTPGAVNGVQFDSGAFGTGTRTFTIPANAPVGTVIPYYCTVHLSNMVNMPTITIVAGAAAATPTPTPTPASTPTSAPTTTTPSTMPGY
jgi:plastocyanin